MLIQAHILAHAFICMYALAEPEVWCAHAQRADTDRAPLRLPLYAWQVSSCALSLSLCQHILLLNWTQALLCVLVGLGLAGHGKQGAGLISDPYSAMRAQGAQHNPRTVPRLCVCGRGPAAALAARAVCGPPARQQQQLRQRGGPCAALRRALRATCRVSCCSRH